MAASIPSNPAEANRSDMTPSAALRQAWYWYISLLFVPFVMSMVVIIVLNNHEGQPSHMTIRSTWFIASICFLLVAGPISFVVRSRMFRSYWRGEGVTPRAYLLGMLTVWFTFEAGGLLSLTGCLVGDSLLPCLLPALASFMFFIPLWPNGHAMSKQAGNTDDPAIYEEPR